MTLVLFMRFLIVLVAMLAAGTFGYLVARHRVGQQNAHQINLLSAEVMRMRRRAGAAESQAATSESRLARTRRKARRA